MGSGEEWGWVGQVNSGMAGPNRLKLGMVEGMGEIVLVRVRGRMIKES